MENINFLLDYFLSPSFPTLEEVNHLSKTQLDIVFISLRPLQVVPQIREIRREINFLNIFFISRTNSEDLKIFIFKY